MNAVLSLEFLYKDGLGMIIWLGLEIRELELKLYLLQEMMVTRGVWLISPHDSPEITNE